MSAIPSSPAIIQQESTQFKAAVSESSLSTMGGTINYLLTVDKPAQDALIVANANNSSHAISIADSDIKVEVVSNPAASSTVKVTTFTAPYNLTVKNINVLFNLNATAATVGVDQRTCDISSPIFNSSAILFMSHGPDTVSPAIDTSGYIYLDSATTTSDDFLGTIGAGLPSTNLDYAMTGGSTLAFTSTVFIAGNVTAVNSSVELDYIITLGVVRT